MTIPQQSGAALQGGMVGRILSRVTIYELYI